MLHDLTRKPRYDREPASGRRALLVLAALLAASAALGWWHGRALDRASASPITRGAAAVVGPFQRGADWMVRGVQGTWSLLHRSRRHAADNRRLRAQVRGLRERNRDLAQLADENQRLRRLLGLRGRLPSAGLAAAVIGRDLGPWNSALVIDRGRRDGVRQRHVVVGLDGLVGQVVTVSDRSARVLPITDPASGVGALVVRPGENGVLKGTGGSCHLRYLSLHTRVKPGDTVITSGLGGIFPPALAVGTVTQVERDASASTSFAVVRPAQNVNRVREVLVLATHAAPRALSGSPRQITEDRLPTTKN